MNPENALDNEGKAFYGVPGPGAYRSATSFHATGVYSAAQTLRRTAGAAIPVEFIEQELADPGRHVYPTAPAYSLKGKTAGRVYLSSEHARADAGYDSPGPKYNTRGATASDMASSPKYTMAGRGLGGALAITAGPGPKYRQWEGGEGSGMRFGTGKNHEELHHKHQSSVPGPGQYKTSPGPEHPAYSFASRDTDHERTRNRLDQSAKVFISADHAKLDFSGLGTPGPGAYGFADSRSTAHTFAREIRSPRKAPYMGDEHMAPDDASPGPAYDVTQPLARSGAKFGQARRDYSPLISKMHALASQLGTESPGPGCYTQPSENVRGVPKFSTARRKGSSYGFSNLGPGPGAYYPQKLDGRHSNNPAFHMGSRLKPGGVFDTIEGVPGPGAYDQGANYLRPESPKRQAIGTFGFAADRTSFIPVNESPGPASYFERDSPPLDGTARSAQASTRSAADRSPGSPSKSGYTFGVTAPRAGTIYISALHAASESYGINSPGPGAYMSDVPRKGKPVTFTKATRKTAIAELADNARDSSPGPAGYRGAAYSSFTKKGGKGGTFGASKRPALSKVSF